MSSHQPILPAQAIALVQARNLEPAETLLADFAAAGLIKTYALMREIRPEGEPGVSYRDSQIPAEEWDRIVVSGGVKTALNGGTVRLAGTRTGGGKPTVQITGVSFSKSSLEKVLDRYCAASGKNEGIVALPTRTKDSLAPEGRTHPDVPSIKPGAKVASIAQVMRATGLGRSKVNGLIKDGTLEKRKFGRRAFVTIESLQEYIGAAVTDY